MDGIYLTKRKEERYERRLQWTSGYLGKMRGIYIGETVIMIGVDWGKPRRKGGYT